MNDLIRNFQEKLIQPVSNRWTLVTIFSIYTLGLYRLLFKLNIKEAGGWEAPATFYGEIYSWGLFSKEFFHSSEVIKYYSALFIIAILCWLILYKWRSLFSFMILLFYILACSHHLENISRASSHTGNVLGLSMLLIWLGHLWGFKDINERSLVNFSLRSTTPFVVPYTIRCFLFIVYTVSGFYKITQSGLSWVSSENIQVYLHYFALSKTGLVSLALESANFSLVLGVSILSLECFAFLGIFHKWLAYALGVSFIMFHLSVTYLFGWTFYSHVVLLVLTATPLAGYLMKSQKDRNLQTS